MTRNEAIAYIRSRSGKNYVTSHDTRMINEICRLDFFEELIPIIHNYCEPVFFSKTKMVEYDWHWNSPSGPNQMAFGLSGHYTPKISNLENALNVTLYPRHDSREDWSIQELEKFFERTPAKSLRINSVLTDQFVGVLDLTKCRNLRYLYGVCPLDLVTGKVKIPGNLKVLETDVNLNFFTKQENMKYLTTDERHIVSNAIISPHHDSRPWKYNGDMQELRDYYNQTIEKLAGKIPKYKGIVGLGSQLENSIFDIIAHRIIADSDKIEQPELLGYQGVVELLKDPSSVKIYVPRDGLWYLNTAGLCMAKVMNPYIERAIIPTMTKCKGMLFEYNCSLHAGDEYYGHISSVRKASLRDGQYFMEMFT
jgi:hypothetical protein